MNEPLNVVDSHFQDLLNPSQQRSSDSSATNVERIGELGFMQIGQRYRIAPAGQFPVQQFMLLLTNGSSMEVKYSNITERLFTRASEDNGLNEMTIRVRDFMQITISGFNLARLNDDMVIQRVVDVGAVNELQATAALKEDRQMPVISRVSIEYGMMDMQNGIWTRGNGQWSDREQRWIPLIGDSRA